jgi:hypothetical protein
MRLPAALTLALFLALPDSASAQDAAAKAISGSEYATVASALEAMRAKNGVKVSVQSGWTVIEDASTLSIWSFTPPGHPAHPAAIHRQVIKEGDHVSLHMKVLCEAPKLACDAMVAEFQKLNGQVREVLKR